jgi:hypothetical protein
MLVLNRVLIGGIVLLMCLARGNGPHAQNAQPSPTTNSTPSQLSNGISVGRPKVFDNRTLTLMLETLNETLRSVQTQFIDQKTLAAALTVLQGTRSRESESSFSISPVPIPSLKQENINTTGNASASGSPLPDTTKQTTTTERSAFTPQAPGLDTLGGFPSGFNPTLGNSASDLLSDQVNLTYQIFNLRMLLERSLTDRLLESGDTRRQAVLGFNVTIDPPRTANDAVAVVEIRLTTSDACSGNDNCLSLVSLMPQEKTYNAAALSTKSHAFGASAVAGAFQLGFSEKHRGQTFYVYRDNDTISYERMDSEVPGQLVFGWMFRPVLGRPSVSPGLRQLFAIVALPSADTTKDYRTRNSLGAQENANHLLPETLLRAEVTTYWKKYDGSTMTAFKEDETNRGKRVRDALLFGLSKPEIFSQRYINISNYNNISVKSTEAYQDKLAPTVDNVWWTPVGSKSVLISIHGNNFFTGTQVALGDKTYATTSDGLIIKSNQALDMVTGFDALAAGSGALIGRYGPAKEIIIGKEPKGIRIADVRVGPSLSGSHSLEIDLQSENGGSLSVRELPKSDHGDTLTPIITINGNVVQLPYSIFDSQSASAVTLLGSIPDAYISKGGGAVRVSWPFREDKWTSTSRFFENIYNVIRLTPKRVIITTTSPEGFKSLLSAEPCWTLLASEVQAIKLQSSTCRTSSVATMISDHAEDITIPSGIPDKLVLISPDKFAYTLDVPKLPTADSGKPKTIVINQCDSAWKEIAVDDISKVGSVEANGLTLKWLPSPPDKDGNTAKTINVLLTTKLTRNPSNVELTVFDKEGKLFLSVPIQINPNPSCKDKGEPQ